jgi:hypothetical protein
MFYVDFPLTIIENMGSWITVIHLISALQLDNSWTKRALSDTQV